MGTDINFKKHLGRTYGTNISIPAIDPAAAAYFTATGITGATQQQAIDTLVKSLKSNNIWSKMKAVYPFVTDNKNLLQYTENFGNAYWNKSLINVSDNTTTAPNGTITADSIIPNTTNNYHVIGANNISTTVNSYTYSIYAKANGYNYISIQFVSNPSYTNYYEGIFNLSNGTVESTSRNLNFTGSRTIQPVGNGWYRCIITINAATVSSIAAMNFIAMPTNDASVPYAGNGTSGIFAWGAQLELGSTATTYQPIATTQQAFISNQFKYNLVNPVDSDAAFRLVFNGGWTHSAQGALPNGTNGYADTKFNQENNWSSNTNAAIGFYSRTDVASSCVDMGALNNSISGNNGSAIYSRYNTNLIYWTVNGSVGAGVSNSNSLGFFIASRNNSTQNKIYKFGTTTINATQTSALSTNINRNIYLGAANDVTAGTAASYSPRQQAFAFISDGLNDTEAANFYTAVQAFQTALNRQV